MNGITDDYLERIQQDTHDLLMAVPSLALARHLIDNEGDIEAKVLKSLANLDDTTGRSGLVILTLLPKVDDAEKNLPGPQINVSQEIQVIEQVVFNRDETSGTGIRSSTAALRVLSALHLQTIGAITWHAARDPVKPLPMAKPGYVSHVVSLRLSLGVPVPPKAAGVSVSNDSGTLTLTSADTIFYTTDGSLPSATAPGANLYSEPIGPFPVGTLIRACGYRPGTNPGDVMEILITA